MIIKKEEIVDIYNLFVDFNIFCDEQHPYCKVSERCPECFTNYLKSKNLIEEKLNDSKN
jgi:hypothetical protein